MVDTMRVYKGNGACELLIDRMPLVRRQVLYDGPSRV